MDIEDELPLNDLPTVKEVEPQIANIHHQNRDFSHDKEHQPKSDSINASL